MQSTSIKSVKKVTFLLKSHFHCGKSDVLSKKHFEKKISLAVQQLKERSSALITQVP